MKDKFSLYQADGFWGIIEDSSDEKQTSVKSYIGADLIIKRLNEQAKQIDQLKQQLDEKQNMIDEINKEFVQAVHDWKALCAEKDKEIAHLKEKDNYHLRYELAGADETITNLKRQLEEKDKDKTQLAIQELEKVKEEFGLKSGWSSETDMCFDLEQFINQQIKELKGEKDDI